MLKIWSYFYEHLYSKELLKDLRDPFDFFFEQQISFDSIKLRKLEILENFQLIDSKWFRLKLIIGLYYELDCQ